MIGIVKTIRIPFGIAEPAATRTKAAIVPMIVARIADDDATR
jgi:hypothetical protein